MRQFQVYLFDFDGTLCDTRASLHPVFKAGFSSVGRDVSEEESALWMHYNLHQTLKMSGVPKEQWNTVIQATIAALDLPESLAMIRAYEETVGVLEELRRRGHKIGIVSNNTSTHIRLVLHQLGIDVPFDCIVGSNMFTHGKPHPEPMEVALRELGFKKDKSIVYVGDSLQDPECGLNAGLSGVLLDRENRHSNYEGARIHELKELLELD